MQKTAWRRAGAPWRGESVTMSDLSPESIRLQISRIIDSPEIGNSPRLQMMLSYIVDEYLAGRERYIKGATISSAVFDSSGDHDPNTSSTVRVEMGRLRRRLSEYYAGKGKDDPVIISIPKGSYVPAFHPNPGVSAELAEPSRESGKPRKSYTFHVAFIGILLALGVYMLKPGETSRDLEIHGSEPRGQAVTVNPEALSMFQQAFALLMPPEDDARLQSAKNLFERVTEIDPQFAGGYAGGSIALSVQVLFVKAEQPRRNLESALELGHQAVVTDPEYPLGYAALALANALSDNPETASEQVKMVLSMRPRDPRANAMAALSLIFSDQPSQAVALLEEALRLNPDNPRAPYMNMLATAYYSVGNYEKAVGAFENSIDRGGPSGPHIWIFLAAGYVKTGRETEAQAIIERLARTDPEYPFASWLGYYVRSPRELEQLMDRLRVLGLP